MSSRMADLREAENGRQNQIKWRPNNYNKNNININIK